MRQARGEGRAIVEGELGLALAQLELLVEGVDPLPVGQHVLLLRGEVRLVRNYQSEAMSDVMQNTQERMGHTRDLERYPGSSHTPKRARNLAPEVLPLQGRFYALGRVNLPVANLEFMCLSFCKIENWRKV